MPVFDTEYELWYSEAQLFIKRFLPERMEDFRTLYKNEKRKPDNIDVLSYTISDAIIGLRVTRGIETIVDPSAAVKKLGQQISILKSVETVLESVISRIGYDIRAEYQDSEIEAAKELLRAGFLRAAGALCGVLLEKHLEAVCNENTIKLRKKNPTLSDYNEALKVGKIIDQPTWRQLQWLGDIRNLCCHNRKEEPTQEQVKDLLEGTIKICKAVS